MKKTALLILSLTFVLEACVQFPKYRPLLASSASPVGKVVFRDAAVFTGASPTLLEHRDVWVVGQTISEISPTDASRPAEVVIDAAGKTLMPGLIDLHVHTTTQSLPPWYLAAPNPKHNLEAFLFAGITTVNDLGGDLEEVGTLRKEVAEDATRGPRIFYAGPIITHRGGYPASLLAEYGPLASLSVTDKICTQIDGAEQARAAALRRVSAGATMIKIVISDIPRGAPRLSDDEIAAVVKVAHLNGLKVAAHIDTTADALTAARLGVDLLAHGVITTELTEADAATLARAKVTMIPTLVNYERFAQIAQKRYRPLQLTVQSEPRQSLEQFGPKYVDAATLTPGFWSWGDEIEAHVKTRPGNALRAFQAGVPLVVGSDAMGSVGTFAADLHHELELLVAAGLPPAEVLMGATGRAAKVLLEDPRFGTVEVGQSADLLLVDGNPLEDVSVTQKLVTVMSRGRLIERLPGHSE